MSDSCPTDQSTWTSSRTIRARRRLSVGDGQAQDNSAPADDTSKAPKVDEVRPKISVIRHITSELTRGYLLERDENSYEERKKRVHTFLRAPRELEKTLTYGLFQCVDAFLFLFTFLPIRVVLAVLRMFTHPCGVLSNRCLLMASLVGCVGQPAAELLDKPKGIQLINPLGSGKFLEPSQIVDLMKAIIILTCIYIYNKVDTSMIYHMVRGQAIIKLYVFYNMLEVCDRLASGFGQDALDALFWTATDPHIRKRNSIEIFFHFLLVIAYVCIHTGMIMCQITVLNVAFNSHNKALLTIMMSNNFVEIKGNLFKRVDKSILFQISCSDVKERFHYYLLLTCVFLQNMTEFHWDPDHVMVILPDAVLVLIAEYIVDWVKHAFIAKFNEIPPEAYADLSVTMARDMVHSRQKHAFMDHSDLLSRRIGFTPIPLAVILIKVCMRSFKIHDWIGMACLGVLWLCLTSLKILSSIVLLGIAAHILSKEDEASVEDETPLDSQVYSHKKSKPAETVESPTPTPRTSTSENHTDEGAPATPAATQFPSETSVQQNTPQQLGNSSPLDTGTTTPQVFVSSAHILISASAPSEAASSSDVPELLLNSKTVPIVSQPSSSTQDGGASDLEVPAREKGAMQAERSEQAETSPPVEGNSPDSVQQVEEGERKTDWGVSALGEDSVAQEKPANDSEKKIPVSKAVASADSFQTPSFIRFSHLEDGVDAEVDSRANATEETTGGSTIH